MEKKGGYLYAGDAPLKTPTSSSFVPERSRMKVANKTGRKRSARVR